MYIHLTQSEHRSAFAPNSPASASPRIASDIGQCASSMADYLSAPSPPPAMPPPPPSLPPGYNRIDFQVTPLAVVAASVGGSIALCFCCYFCIRCSTRIVDIYMRRFQQKFYNSRTRFWEHCVLNPQCNPDALVCFDLLLAHRNTHGVTETILCMAFNYVRPTQNSQYVYLF